MSGDANGIKPPRVAIGKQMTTTTYLASDTRFGHAGIIKYCARPFGSVEEMDATKIERWNAAVSPDDAPRTRSRLARAEE